MKTRSQFVAMLSLGLVPALAGAVVVSVDCSIPESISAAIASIAPPTLVEVEISNGPCAEDVIIERDNVVIRPDPAGGSPFSITGSVTPDPEAEGATVFIRNARRVTLEGLAISGGDSGVRVVQSQENILIVSGNMNDNAVWGLQVASASNVIVENGATMANNGRGGISIADVSTVTCRSCEVLGAPVYGIRVVQGSSVTLQNDTAINSDGRGIFAEDARVRIDGPSFAGLVVEAGVAAITAKNSVVEVLGGVEIVTDQPGATAVEASGGSVVRVAGNSAPPLPFGGGVDHVQLGTFGTALSLLVDGNSTATVTNADLQGAVSARGQSVVLLFDSQQSTNGSVTNSAIESSYLGVDNTGLLGTTRLTTFARGRFSAATLDDLECRTEADALCQGGTTISGTSSCSDCPVAPPPPR